MYEAQAEKDWKHIINDSDSKLVLVATERRNHIVKVLSPRPLVPVLPVLPLDLSSLNLS